jgi:hypothetical protein
MHKMYLIYLNFQQIYAKKTVNINSKNVYTLLNVYLKYFFTKNTAYKYEKTC